jgi:hypothetical protein
MANDEQPILPRAVDDPERVRELREEALAKLDGEPRPDAQEALRREEREREPAPVYGGPPVRRRWWKLGR